MLIYVGELYPTEFRGGLESDREKEQNRVFNALCDVVDEMNRELDYEVRLVHLDGVHYIEFLPKGASDGETGNH